MLLSSHWCSLSHAAEAFQGHEDSFITSNSVVFYKQTNQLPTVSCLVLHQNTGTQRNTCPMLTSSPGKDVKS